MVVRNGVETQNVTSKDFDLTSASASRVLLPCRAWGELRLEMMNAALGMMSEEELHKVCDVPYEKVVQHEDVKFGSLPTPPGMLFWAGTLMPASQSWQTQPKLQAFWTSSFHAGVVA